MVQAQLIRRLLERHEEDVLPVAGPLAKELERELRLPGPHRSDHEIGALGDKAPVQDGVELRIAGGDPGRGWFAHASSLGPSIGLDGART